MRRPDFADDPVLADVAEALRAVVAETQHRPSPELARVLAQGVPAEVRVAAAPSAVRADRPRHTSPREGWSWGKFRRAPQQLAVRLAGLTLVTKVGLGTAVAAAAVGGAGAGGALPFGGPPGPADVPAVVDDLDVVGEAVDLGDAVEVDDVSETGATGPRSGSSSDPIVHEEPVDRLGRQHDEGDEDDEAAGDDDADDGAGDGAGDDHTGDDLEGEAVENSEDSDGDQGDAEPSTGADEDIGDGELEDADGASSATGDSED